MTSISIYGHPLKRLYSGCFRDDDHSECEFPYKAGLRGVSLFSYWLRLYGDHVPDEAASPFVGGSCIKMADRADWASYKRARTLRELHALLLTVECFPHFLLVPTGSYWFLIKFRGMFDL